MKTVYDWVTVLIFAGLVTHFLNQSTKPNGGEISLWHYLLPSGACAVANWLGNEGQDAMAILVIFGVGYYIFHFFGPHHKRPPQD